MRERWLTIIVVAAVFVVLLAYQVTYTVRVDQVAAHYRFGRVIKIVRPTLGLTEEQARQALAQGEASGVPVIPRAGCFLKLPWPVDRIRWFDQRIRYVDGHATQLQLPDENQLIPRVYATWRISDPVAFQKSLMGEEEQAKDALRQIIGGRTQEVFGRYRLHDIVNTDADQLKFDQIEREILEAVKSAVESSDKAYGIEVCSLGISWIALPDSATTAVFARMEQERRTEAEKLMEEGKKIRRTTVAEAQEKRDKVLADAEARAKGIRAEAEAEAAKSYEVFARNPDLSILLRSLESLENMTKSAADKNAPFTFVLDTKTPPFDRLLHGSSAAASPEEVPPSLPVPVPLQAQGGSGAAPAPAAPALSSGSEGSQ